jgi:hypothetical protein
MTNVGRWATWYQDMAEPWPYGDTTSYAIGATWLAECALIEDWGCGPGWLRTLLPVDRYRGIDGTASPCCDVVVDLIAYRSAVPGIFMRHVLEHNDAWGQILDNAVASFTERMALILFTPERATTGAIAVHPELGVPDIAFRLTDLTDRFPPDVTYTVQQLLSATQYGGETILLLERHLRWTGARRRPRRFAHGTSTRACAGSI